MAGVVTVSATASDNVAVADVEFLLDGVSIGVDASAPYAVQWTTTTTSNGQHNLSARARDTAGNFGLTSGVVTVTVDNPALPAGLVAAWNFNEGTGSTAGDVTGNGNTVTLRNNPLWTAGKYGTGLRLDGTGQYLSVANSPTINVSGAALTFSAWVNPVGGGGDQVLFGKFYNATMSSPYYQFGIELAGGTSPSFYVGTASGLAGASMGSALPAGPWSHLAVVFAGNQVRFYRNGTLVSSPSVSASIVARTSPMHLGADLSPGQYFNGSLDDVRLYNRTQTQAEVAADQNTPLPSPAGNPGGPTVSITSPASNAQVTGLVTITANAGDDVAVERVPVVDRLPARRARAPGAGGDRGEERQPHDSDEWPRLQWQHAVPDHVDRHGLGRADGHEDGHRVPGQGEPVVRHGAGWADAVPRRDREDDAVQLRHVGWLQPHGRGA